MEMDADEFLALKILERTHQRQIRRIVITHQTRYNTYKRLFKAFL